MKKSIYLSLIVFLPLQIYANNYYTFEATTKNKKKRNLQNISQYISKNISRKSTRTETIECDYITIYQTDQLITLSSQTFGPLPVVLKITNTKGVVDMNETNENNLTSIFKIPTQQLSNNSKIQVVNAFDETIFCKKVKIIDQNSTQ
jgi:hypothetical protein